MSDNLATFTTLMAQSVETVPSEEFIKKLELWSGRWKETAASSVDGRKAEHF